MISAINLYTLDEMKELILSNTAKYSIGKLNGELGADVLISIINYLGDAQTPTQPNVFQWVIPINISSTTSFSYSNGIIFNYTWSTSGGYPNFFLELSPLFVNQTDRDAFVDNNDWGGSTGNGTQWAEMDYVNTQLDRREIITNEALGDGSGSIKYQKWITYANSNNPYYVAVRITALLNTDGVTFTPPTTTPVVITKTNFPILS